MRKIIDILEICKEKNIFIIKSLSLYSFYTFPCTQVKRNIIVYQ